MVENTLRRPAKQRVVNLIPTFNEKENVGTMVKVLEKIAQQNAQYAWRHLIVDDHSVDGTADTVRQLMHKNSHIYLLEGPRVGLGDALCRGYLFAIKNLRADIIISNDCDFSYDPHRIPLMLEKIRQGCDVVVASRHIRGGASEGWTAFRRFNHFIANDIFAGRVAGIREVHDHNGNFRAMRVAGALDQIRWDKIPVKGFGFLMYALYKLSIVTEKFCEFPVVFTFRTKGESKVSFNRRYIKTYLRDVLEYIKLCCIIMVKRWRIKKEN